MQDLTARVANELGYRDRTSGVLVVDVDPNGPAAEQGIGRGMLILKVRKREVLTVEQFREALKGESVERGVLLLVATPDRRGADRHQRKVGKIATNWKAGRDATRLFFNRIKGTRGPRRGRMPRDR